MKAEEYVSQWIDNQYGGQLHINDWTQKEVLQFAEDYHNNEFKAENLPISNVSDRRELLIAKLRACDLEYIVHQDIHEILADDIIEVMNCR